jgi:small subunit ribosomal protein S14
MAKVSKIISCERRKQKFAEALAAGRKPKFPTRVYNRCKVCGRVGGYIRQFQMCRICFREYATQGKLMGVKKSSW